MSSLKTRLATKIFQTPDYRCAVSLSTAVLKAVISISNLSGLIAIYPHSLSY